VPLRVQLESTRARAYAAYDLDAFDRELDSWARASVSEVA
jgi:hypothetical protein